MPKALHVLPLLLIGLLAAACSSAPGELRPDVEGYVRHLNDWAPAEAETARTIDRILATQFVDEAEVRRQIAADSPRVAHHVETIEAYSPATPPVRDIHRQYVEAWQGVASGYRSILEGLDGGDASKIAAGRRALEQWRATIVGVADQVRRLRDSA
jgi:hypothetical protein